MRTMVCKFCGADFVATNKTGPPPLCCSSLCRRRYYHGSDLQELSKEHSCTHCGKVLDYPRQKKFCSKECYRLDRVKHVDFVPHISQCELCSAEFDKQRHSQRFCSPQCRRKDERKRGYVRRPSKKIHEFICRHCGKVYRTARKDCNTYCSRECSFADKEAWCACGASLRGTGRKECDVCAQIHIPKICECVVCGVKFETWRAGAKYCSRDCVLEKERTRARDAFVSVALTNDVVIKQCLFCGKAYETNYYASRRLFCSKRCSKRHVRQNRKHNGRAQEQHRRRQERMKKPAGAELVYRAKVFERDGWRCQICGKKVDPKLEWPHPKSATLDHIVPLAQGGTHEPRNCQLAHAICNSRKSDAGVFQLRLIG